MSIPTPNNHFSKRGTRMENVKIKRRYSIYHVYLLSNGNGYCKVGIAKNIKQRLSSLQCGSPFRLSLVDKWEFKSFDEAYISEQLILCASVNSVCSGEWIKSVPTTTQRLCNLICKKILSKKKVHFRGQYFSAWRQLDAYNGAINE